MVDIFWREVVRSARRAASSAWEGAGRRMEVVVVSVAVVSRVERKDLRDGGVAWRVVDDWTDGRDGGAKAAVDGNEQAHVRATMH